MIIKETEAYIASLKEVLAYIATDNKSAAKAFHKGLRQKIAQLKSFPWMYRASIYFDNPAIRDLIYKGYTVPYLVDEEKQTITIIGITKYKKELF